MPTFGYQNDTTTTAVGPSSAVKSAVSQAIPESTGVVQTGHARVQAASAGKDIVFVIYSNKTVGGVDQPDQLLAKSDVLTDIPSGSDQTLTFPFTGSNQITVTQGEKYWIGYSWNNQGGSLTGYRAPSNIAPGRWEHEDFVFPDPWNPFDSGGTDGNARALSGPIVAWVTYEEDSGPVTETHKFYLNNAPAVGKPGLLLGSAWNAQIPDVAENAQRLGSNPAGPSAYSTATESVSTNPFDVLMLQFVSAPATADGSIVGDYALALGRMAEEADANIKTRWAIWIYTGDPDAPLRGFGVARNGSSYAPTTPTGYRLTGSLDEIPFLAGDRIIVEVGYRAENSTADPRTGRVYYGGEGSTDISAGDADMNHPGYLELAITTGVTFEEPEPSFDPTRFFLAT